jgi:hypothetical protein
MKKKTLTSLYKFAAPPGRPLCQTVAVVMSRPHVELEDLLSSPMSELQNFSEVAIMQYTLKGDKRPVCCSVV